MGGFTFGVSKKEGILLLFYSFWGTKIYRVMVRYTRNRVFGARGKTLKTWEKTKIYRDIRSYEKYGKNFYLYATARLRKMGKNVEK